MLEVELELYQRNNLGRVGLLEEDVQFDAERFLKTFEGIWEKILATEKRSEATAGSAEADVVASWEDERELGRIGVCVAPLKEV